MYPVSLNLYELEVQYYRRFWSDGIASLTYWGRSDFWKMETEVKGYRASVDLNTVATGFVLVLSGAKQSWTEKWSPLLVKPSFHLLLRPGVGHLSMYDQFFQASPGPYLSTGMESIPLSCLSFFHFISRARVYFIPWQGCRSMIHFIKTECHSIIPFHQCLSIPSIHPLSFLFFSFIYIYASIPSFHSIPFHSARQDIPFHSDLSIPFLHPSISSPFHSIPSHCIQNKKEHYFRIFI